jgi:hypothetical protein
VKEPALSLGSLLFFEEICQFEVLPKKTGTGGYFVLN